RARQVVERQVIPKDLADANNLLVGRVFSGSSNLAAKVFKLLGLLGCNSDKTGFLEGVVQKVGNLLALTPQFSALVLLLLFALIRRWKKVREEFERNGKEQFPGWHNDEYRERNQSAQIFDCTFELYYVSLIPRTQNVPFFTDLTM